MNKINPVKFFFREKSGNFGFITALVLPLLLFFAGLIIDFGNGINARHHLQAASDSASLAVSTAYTNGQKDMQKLTEMAKRYFLANSDSSNIDPATLDLKISVSANTNPKYVSVDVSGKMNLFMSGLYGVSTWDIAASTRSTIGSDTYFQVAFLLDNSGSMAIGGTDDDIQKLVDKIGCAFACHDPFNYSGGDKVAIARENGIKLKFDYVQSALNIFVDKLKPEAIKHPSNYLMGIFTVGSTFSTHLDMTTDTVTFDNSAMSVDLETMLPYTCATHNGFTNIANGFSGVVSKVGNVGDGTSASKRKSYIVLISDGVQDVLSGCRRQYSANYAAACAQAKAAGFNIITIQTGYPYVDQPDFIYKVKPLLPTIQKTLQACASSPDNYIHADDGPAIEAAIAKAFETIFGDVRIES